MARIAARNASLYLNLASGGIAEQVAYVAQFDIGAASDRFEVTAFGDANKVYVAGLPDASGSFSGFYDNATVQTFTSALDGVPRKMYFYPDRTNPSQYFWGTAFFDFSASFPVGGAATVSGNWSAASNIVKVG